MSDPFGIVGSTLAEKYVVERVIGEGGYGVVYGGSHAILGTRVAVKLLKPVAGVYSGEQTATQQFLREARVLFSLSHPAIVRMYDVGEISTRVGTVPYVVLELLEGVGLDEELARRRRAGQGGLAIRELGAVFEPVLEGLAFAHEQGVAHRDLKPSNVMLVRTAQGELTAKLLDFGTARAGAQDVSLGTTGFTPRYAAPEQWDPSFGHPGPASDLFSLGLILAEACTLEPAFGGATAGQILQQAVSPHVVVGVRARRPDLPPAIDDVIARATRRPAHERFASAREMLEALRAALRSSVMGAGPAFAPPPPGYAPPAGIGAHAAITGPAVITGPAPPTLTGPHAPIAPRRGGGSSTWMFLLLGGAPLLFLLVVAVGLVVRLRGKAATEVASVTVDAGGGEALGVPSGDDVEARDDAGASPIPGHASARPHPSHAATATAVPSGQPGIGAIVAPSASVASSASNVAPPSGSSHLVLLSSKVRVGDRIEVRIVPAAHAAPGERTWITLVPKGTPDTQWREWSYLDDGTSSFRFVAKEPGDFEVRLHDAYPRLTTHLIARVPVQVLPGEEAPTP